MPVTAVLGSQPAVKASSTDGTSFTVDPYRSHTIAHLGKDAAGDDDTALIAIGVGVVSDAADYTEDDNKLLLPSGAAVLLPAMFRGTSPGTTKETLAATIFLKSASGAPVVNVIPGPKER